MISESIGSEMSCHPRYYLHLFSSQKPLLDDYCLPNCVAGCSQHLSPWNGLHEQKGMLRFWITWSSSSYFGLNCIWFQTQITLLSCIPLRWQTGRASDQLLSVLKCSALFGSVAYLIGHDGKCFPSILMQGARWFWTLPSVVDGPLQHLVKKLSDHTVKVKMPFLELLKNVW